MGKIVVNTEQLRKQARDIQKASDDLRAVSGQLSVLINSVNHDAYQGQLTNKIREILGGVENRAGQLAGNLSELQKELNRRADLFDEANRKAIQAILPRLTGEALRKFGERRPSTAEANNTSKPAENASEGSPASISIGLSQNDPRWAGDKMGENGLLIGNSKNSAGDTVYGVGCYITAIAMLGRHHGLDITPKDINEYLREKGGYGRWVSEGEGEARKQVFIADSSADSSKAADFLTLKLQENNRGSEKISLLDRVTDMPSEGKKESIDAAITEHTAVILHLKTEDNNGHFVLAVDQGEDAGIWVYDPLEDNKRLVKYEDVQGLRIFSLTSKE